MDYFYIDERVGFYTNTYPNIRFGTIKTIEIKFKDYWEYEILDELNNNLYKVINKFTTEDTRHKLYKVENSVHFIVGDG